MAHQWVSSTSQLPPADNGRTTTHGYAVVFHDQLVYFFRALEPALAFGRSARMSEDIGRYGVHPAAKVEGETAGDDPTMVIVRDNVDRGEDEPGRLIAWARAVDPDRAEWPGPAVVSHHTTADRFRRGWKRP